VTEFRRWQGTRILICLGALACAGRAVGPPAAPAQAGQPDFRRDSSDFSRPLKIIVYGDMRFTDPHEMRATNPKVRLWLVDKIAEEKPDAVLLSGDVPWRGGVAGDYAVYRSETEIWRDEHLSIYPALGNHEFKGEEQQCLENWWSAFPELRGRRWYSVQLSNSVYAFNLDSNSSFLADSQQLAWLRRQVANLPATVRFVFLNLHHPPVVDFQPNGDASHNGRPNEKALAEFLAGVSANSRVRFIVATGHVHNYERFLQNGIVYLVSGGGGADPYRIVRSPEDLFRGSDFPNYHYVRFVENGDHMEGTMVRVADPDAPAPTWQERDHFEIPAVAPARSAAAGRGK
jgi:calcineurin-like phosphoesterase family protein